MDRNKFPEINFLRGTKEEILDSFKNLCSETGIIMSYEDLKKLVPAAQLKSLEMIVENETRTSIAESQPEMEEEDIQYWVDADIEGRIVSFSKNEEGQMILLDASSRVKDEPYEVSECDFELGDFSELLDAIKNSLNLTMDNMPDSERVSQNPKFNYLYELSTKLVTYENRIAELKEMKSKISDGTTPEHLLEFAKMITTKFSSEDIRNLIGDEMYTMADAAREGEILRELDQYHFPEDLHNQEMARMREDRVYKLSVVEGQYFLSTSDNPYFTFGIDPKKMQSPEFFKTIMKNIQLEMPMIEQYFGGYHNELISDIIEAIQDPTQTIDVSKNEVQKFAKVAAKEEDVILESEQAGKVIETLERDKDELTSEREAIE